MLLQIFKYSVLFTKSERELLFGFFRFFSIFLVCFNLFFWFIFVNLSWIDLHLFICFLGDCFVFDRCLDRLVLWNRRLLFFFFGNSIFLRILCWRGLRKTGSVFFLCILGWVGLWVFFLRHWCCFFFGIFHWWDRSGISLWLGGNGRRRGGLLLGIIFFLLGWSSFGLFLRRWCWQLSHDLFFLRWLLLRLLFSDWSLHLFLLWIRLRHCDLLGLLGFGLLRVHRFLLVLFLDSWCFILLRSNLLLGLHRLSILHWVKGDLLGIIILLDDLLLLSLDGLFFTLLRLLDYLFIFHFLWGIVLRINIALEASNLDCGFIFSVVYGWYVFAFWLLGRFDRLGI